MNMRCVFFDKLSLDSFPHQINRFEKELATGDTKSASDRLRGFFEQYFHEGTDSSVSPFVLMATFLEMTFIL